MYGYTNPYYQQNYATNYAQSAPTQDERIWVQNETSADAYLVAPNGFVRLWDSNKPIFYEKRADASGRPYPVEAYKYEKIASNRGVENEGNRIELSNQIEGLTRRIEALEEGYRHEHESNADDTAIQSIQKSVSRRSKGTSGETDS